LEPSGENHSFWTFHLLGDADCQRIEFKPESRLNSLTTLLDEVVTRRLRAGEKATCASEKSAPSVSDLSNRRPGTSHKSTLPSSQPTARRLPSGEKLRS